MLKRAEYDAQLRAKATARDAAIVAEAVKGARADEIAKALGVSRSTAWKAIREARRAGIAMPHYPPGRPGLGSARSTSKPSADPKPTSIPVPMASADSASDLIAKGVPLTMVAAFTRRPYRELSAILDAQRGRAG